MTRQTSAARDTPRKERYGTYLWNGYVDAYVAIYAVLAAVAIHNWLQEDDVQYLVLGGLAACVMLSLKQEGMI